MTVIFAPGTPEAVRQVFLHCFTQHNDPRMRVLIERLAAEDAFSGLWGAKISPASAREVAWMILLAYERAINIPKTRRHALFYELVSDPTVAEISITARLAKDALIKNDKLLRARWSEWPGGDPSMDFDRLLANLENLCAFGDRLYAELQEYNSLLPKFPRRLRNKTAQRVYFCQVMKAFFKRSTGAEQIGVVTELEQLVFDLPQGTDESTVRKRKVVTENSSQPA